LIIDQYAYQDVAGRVTNKTTTINREGPLGDEQVKVVNMSQSYNELDLPVMISYPMCTGCGAPPNDADRSQMTRTYDHGRITALGRPGSQSFITGVTFWPNGMRKTLTHGNGIIDTQDVGNMQRPTALSFGTYDHCVQPIILAQPTNTTSSGSGASVTLSVTASGTGTLEYQWFDAVTGTDLSKYTASITVNPTTTTEYYVRVTGACGSVTSQVVVVSINACTPPSTGPITPTRQTDGSYILRPDPRTGASPTFTWRIQPANTVVGSQRELTVTITQTTSYTLTITDSCGTSSATSVTINIPLQITKTGLVATASGTTVNVSWPAVTGATDYLLQRRSGGPWQEVFVSTNSYSDPGLLAEVTYAYRVSAIGSGGTISDYSNTDVATTRSFPFVSSSAAITAESINNMLLAVNSVRAAAGWGAVGWSDLLTPGDVGPVPGGIVSARHVMVCRVRMNEALQALGVPAQGNIGLTDLVGATARTADVNEVFQRAQ
jgi:hypothetical protein